MTIRRLVRRMLNSLRPASRADADLAREVQAHLALLEDDFVSRGLPADAARAAAQRALGSTALAADLHRDARSVPWIDDAQRDVRFALRLMRRTPGFTLLAVVTLALGIGATAAIFTLINNVLLRSLPVRAPDRLVVLGDARGSGTAIGRQGGSFTLFSYDLYRRLRDERGFDGLCAVQSSKARVSVRRASAIESEPLYARFVSANYFDVLGAGAARGRLLTSADEAAGAAPVAIVSYRYWTDRLHRDASIVGSVVRVDRVPVTIVGVASPEFFGETLEADPPSFWIPLSAERQLEPARRLIDAPDVHWLYLIGRLRPQSTADEAEAHVTAALQQWLRERAGTDLSPDTQAQIAKTRIPLTAGNSGITHARRTYAGALRLLLAIAAVVLLIACANIASLLLARGAARETERAIRLAIGASRSRLIRQLLTESLTLAFAGGALGLALASWGVQVLLALVFSGADVQPFSASPDARVLSFTFALSCGAAIVFGLLPAIRGSAVPQARSTQRSAWGATLIVVQVALSLVVIAAAGALTRSLSKLSTQAFGFELTHMLVVDVDPAAAGYDVNRLGGLYRDLHARLNAVPGVARAAFSYYSPFDQCCWAFTIAVPGHVARPEERRSAMLNRVSPGYFETLGTRVVRGRTFDDRDAPRAAQVAVVNAAFVDRFVPGGDPIGARFSVGDGGISGAIEVVGVVENAKYDTPRDETEPMAFLPLLQTNGDDDADSVQSHFIRTIEVRAAGDPAAVVAGVRQAIAATDPDLPVLRVNTLPDQVAGALNRESTVATLAGFFGLVALVLTGVGLYGLTAYSVERRTREIGIRVALGAERARVAAMVIRDVLRHGAIGTVVGVPAAVVAIHLIRSSLYGVSPADGRDAALAALILLASMLPAGYGPARRASRIEPVEALRHE